MPHSLLSLDFEKSINQEACFQYFWQAYLCCCLVKIGDRVQTRLWGTCLVGKPETVVWVTCRFYSVLATLFSTLRSYLNG